MKYNFDAGDYSRPIFRPEVSEFLTHFSGLLSCKIKK